MQLLVRRALRPQLQLVPFDLLEGVFGVVFVDFEAKVLLIALDVVILFGVEFGLERGVKGRLGILLLEFGLRCFDSVPFNPLHLGFFPLLIIHIYALYYHHVYFKFIPLPSLLLQRLLSSPPPYNKYFYIFNLL